MSEESQMSPVDAALSYVAFLAGMSAQADLWKSNYPRPAPGDRALGLLETETRPHCCARILAVEVVRLRGLLNAGGANQ